MAAPELVWEGKAEAVQLAQQSSPFILQARRAESLGWETARHVLIEGDCLDALKLLRPTLAGRVKFICIDPPYNTGKQFLYRDAGSTGDWLGMMHARLAAARPLLRDDGLLAVQMSDARLPHLRLLLDELYGAENFIGCVVWKSTKTVTNRSLLSVSHTHNVLYAKRKAHFTRHREQFRLPEEGVGFANPDDDPRGPWKADPYQVGGYRAAQAYPIRNPATGQEHLPSPGCSWKNSRERFERLIADRRIVFGASGRGQPMRKRFLSEALQRGRVARTWWDDVGTTTSATMALRKLMGDDVFDYPKPVALLERLVDLCAHDPQDAVVLDFFAGSGATAQAVLQRNLADGGRRRWILVQSPEPFGGGKQAAAERYCRRMGVPETLAELTKERMRRFAASQPSDAAADLGFRVFRTAPGQADMLDVPD